MLTQTAPGQGNVTYTYDASGRALSINQNSNSVAFTYDALERRQTVTLPNSIKATYGYDPAGRISSITYTQNANSVGTLLYTYDADSHIVAVGGTLARVTLPTALSSLVYDDAGELTSNGNQTWTYDADGNPTAGNGNSYTWDSRNQLVSLAHTGFSAQFNYLPNGQRLSKTVAGSTTQFLYNGTNFIQEQNATGAVTANLLVGLGVDQVYARTTSAGMNVFLTDFVGSTIGLTSTAGVQNANYSYTPYGASVVTGTVSGNTQTFTGREDDGTGLLYYRARYYDPQVGRFLQMDPAGLGAIPAV